MVNCAEVAPAAIVTEAGKEKLTQSEFDSATTAPPAGAAEVNVTVPVAALPAMITAGVTPIPANAAGGFTVSVAAFATPL
jgi:hypothetical protein